MGSSPKHGATVCDEDNLLPVPTRSLTHTSRREQSSSECGSVAGSELSLQGPGDPLPMGHPPCLGRWAMARPMPMSARDSESLFQGLVPVREEAEQGPPGTEGWRSLLLPHLWQPHPCWSWRPVFPERLSLLTTLSCLHRASPACRALGAEAAARHEGPSGDGHRGACPKGSCRALGRQWWRQGPERGCELIRQLGSSRT